MKKINKKELIIRDKDGVLSTYYYCFGDEFSLEKDTWGPYNILEGVHDSFDCLYYNANINGVEIITSNLELEKEIKAEFATINDNNIKITKLLYEAKNLVFDTDEKIRELFDKYSENIEEDN
jgi:hypothetical protein